MEKHYVHLTEEEVAAKGKIEWDKQVRLLAELEGCSIEYAENQIRI